MIKSITSYLQLRCTIRVISILLDNYKHISGIRQFNSRQVAKHIIHRDMATLPRFIGPKNLPRHLVHHFSIAAYVVGNVVVKVANNPGHPAHEELLVMYMRILDEIMQVVLAPGSYDRFKFTEADDELISMTIDSINSINS